MLDNVFLKDLGNRISKLIPKTSGVREDVEDGIQEVLQSAFSRLNLVTREEFDAQLKVLDRAENTIAALEEKITALEKSHGAMPHSAVENEKQ